MHNKKKINQRRRNKMLDAIWSLDLEKTVYRKPLQARICVDTSFILILPQIWTLMQDFQPSCVSCNNILIQHSIFLQTEAALPSRINFPADSNLVSVIMGEITLHNGVIIPSI
uniref:Uncharacterized protein n=1 Tax=Cacopsylla melanoneura TaxID=428564 RepID=A0A8D8WEH6_9HEMI